MALHQAQKFIESYLDDWKSHRYQKEGDADEKMQQANQQFSVSQSLNIYIVFLVKMDETQQVSLFLKRIKSI